MIYILNFICNLFIIASIITMFVYLYDIHSAKIQERKMLGLITDDSNKKKIIANSKFFKSYYNLIRRILSEKGFSKYSEKIFYTIIIISILIAIYFISINQLFLAILAPVSINIFIRKVLEVSMDDLDEKLETQLPYCIDTIIRVFSRYGDLKTIVYETAKSVDNPLRKKLEGLSIKLASQNQEKSLMSFAEEINNIWVYSLIYILLSYKEDSKKEDTIENLRHLRNIIEQENLLKTASVTDKKYSVMVNYTIAGLSFIASIFNIALNPIGKSFFFGSMEGIICFLVGYGSIFITIIININMSKKKRRKV